MCRDDPRWSSRRSSEQILRVKGGTAPIPSILVGNKIDLTGERQVTGEEAAAIAREWSVPYIETSAKEKHNVDKIYSELMRLIRPSKGTKKISENSGSQRETMEVERVAEKKPCCVIL